MTWTLDRIDRSGTSTAIVVFDESGARDVFNFAFDQGGDYLERFITALTNRVTVDIALLNLAVAVIEGLADQQAMSDDWWVESLGKIKERLKDT